MNQSTSPSTAERERLATGLLMHGRPIDPYFGFVRVATAVTHTKVADPFYNLERHTKMVQRFIDNDIDVGQFGELSLTGYSCGRFFQQATLRRSAKEALIQLNRRIKEMGYHGVVIVGVPLVIDDGLYNCTVAMCRGRFLGVSVKRFPPNYEEFTELKQFAYGRVLTSTEIVLDGQVVPCGTNLVFKALDVEHLGIGLPICEDDWVIGASSFFLAAWGATLLCSLNGSNELIGKESHRSIHQVVGISARCIAANIYSSQGPGESTTDTGFSGYCGIAENGSMLAEVKPLAWVDTIGDPEILGESLTFTDIDLDHIAYDRLRTNSFLESAQELRLMKPHRVIEFTLERSGTPRALARKIDAHPYVPQSKDLLTEVCDKLVRIKLAGDVSRLLNIGNPPVWVAVSGGLDSTSRLLDAVKAKDATKRPRTEVHAVTMPGFGTSSRTYNNIVGLCTALGVTFHEVDIKPLAFAVMKAMGHKPFGINIKRMSLAKFLTRLESVSEDAEDLNFENAQAHIRTLIITRFGFSFGTGDMSELIIGWCTWLADQLGGHYNSQATMPKTLVRFQVKHQAETDPAFAGAAAERLIDIHNTKVSPELKPTHEGQVTQLTDDINGPEEVRDFFMRYFRRFGDTPEKIMYLVRNATGWAREYTQEELNGWWQRFATRVFSQRYKNACRTDGVQVGSDSLSPHGNWLVPSDASSREWLLPQGFDIIPFLARIDREVKESTRVAA